MPNSDNWPRYVLELPRDAIGFESNLPIEDGEIIGIGSQCSIEITIERRGDRLVRIERRIESVTTRRVRSSRAASGLRHFSLF